ncbi:MAG: hypothetical protein AABX66_04120 [Nanoarchaeota archaeon]
MEEQSEKEKRVRAITRLYYSNPSIQKAILEFCQQRETVPRYFEGFGKRPDVLTYPSDIMGLVNKGATSFHTSEEIWNDPLNLKTDMTQEEIKSLRKSWDLLIDVDSPFLDCSKIATQLLIAALEQHGIKNFCIKFSGSKGFHIIVSGKAFPEEYDGKLMKEMFPEWPRAISEYLMDHIKREYNVRVGQILGEKEVLARTNLKKEDLDKVSCKKCGQEAVKGEITLYLCPICHMKLNRKEVKQPNRKIRCLNGKCGGILEVLENKEYYFCENCKDFENDKIALDSEKNPEMFEKFRGMPAKEFANLDMVLVAPRHLFRTPYSLNEKTSLASIVITKEELNNFSPKDADPLKVKIKDFLPNNSPEEAKKLLIESLKWKKDKESLKEEVQTKKYAKYDKIDVQGVTEEMFPAPIKKLFKGLTDGKKRGLFIIITFLKSLNFPSEYIIKKVNEWNKLNEPPLREGYVKSQLDWHLRQKKQILPPNYENPSFYKDLNLLDKKPDAKNPISEVLRKLRSNY